MLIGWELTVLSYINKLFVTETNTPDHQFPKSKGLLWLKFWRFYFMIVALGLWQHIIAGTCGGGKPLTSWSWPRSEKQPGGARSPTVLFKSTSPPTSARPHLLKVFTAFQ